MQRELRSFFDAQLEAVLPRLPGRVRQILEEVPLYVEDFPSREVMGELALDHRSELCGLYTGVPLTQRSVEDWGVLSDAIHLYREGLLALASDRRGEIDEEELRRQIGLTILHELGHLHGMSEEELEGLGY